MSFMEMFIYNKAPLYSAPCDKCGADIFAHESNGTRLEELQDGTAECSQCASGHANPEVISYAGKQYAGRYSAPGYMDCTDWHYGKNLRELKRELRDFYGD